VVLVGFMSEVLSKLFDLLVDLSLNFLDNLGDHVLLDLECLADVVGDDAVGDSLLADLHAALGDEDGFFSTEGHGVGRVHLGLHHLDLRLGEAFVGVSQDGGTGHKGSLEGASGEGSLFHEAHGVVTSSNLSPDSVVPGLATELEDGGNTVLSLLRDDSVVVFAVVVVVDLLKGFLGFVDSLLSSLDGSLSSTLGSLALGILDSLLSFLDGLLGSDNLLLDGFDGFLSDSGRGLGQGSNQGSGDNVGCNV